MCGRFTQRQPAPVIAQEFQVDEVPSVEARYNIAPTQTVLSIHQGADGREAKLLKWGLIPSWAKDPSIGAKLINARSETVAEKPSFREAFKKRRCLVPADGFYEWQRTGDRKQPYFFRMRDDRLFGFAGLWERWKDEEGKVVETCSILTTEANELLQPIHDRMPVILHAEDYDLWLDEDARKQNLRTELLRPFPASAMVAYPVGALVNNPRSQGAGLIEEMKINSA